MNKIHIDQERVIDLYHDLFFQQGLLYVCVRNLIKFSYSQFVLANFFDRIHSSIILKLCKMNFSVRSGADYQLSLELT